MTSPSRREIEHRLDRLSSNTDPDHDEAAYYRWFRRCLCGEVDHNRETPPDGLDSWFETPAGQATIGRSVAKLRTARQSLKDPTNG